MTAPMSTTAMPTIAQKRVSVSAVSIWSLSDNPMKTTPLFFTWPSLPVSLHGSATTLQGACAACMMEWSAVRLVVTCTTAFVVKGCPNVTPSMLPSAGRLGSDTTPSMSMGTEPTPVLL